MVMINDDVVWEAFRKDFINIEGFEPAKTDSRVKMLFEMWWEGYKCARLEERMKEMEAYCE